MSEARTNRWEMCLTCGAKVGQRCDEQLHNLGAIDRAYDIFGVLDQLLWALVQRYRSWKDRRAQGDNES